MGAGTADCGDGGNSGKKNTEFTVKDLAGEIDSLEKHIEKFGSIVPKHADVWGQARLTAYRQEFERVMRADIYLWQPSLQATIRASDQAFLANALSLSAGVKGVTAPAATGASSLITTTNDAITRDSLVQTSTISNFLTPTGKLALEPTLLEDQKRRYLDHLNQLRRNNQGDDNTDAPGYALYLMRFPVSILTGGCTKAGYGGECTMTATPHLPDDLLPQTFRDLVINDLVGLLTLPFTQIIDRTKTQIEEDSLKCLLDQFEQKVKEQSKKKTKGKSNDTQVPQPSLSLSVQPNLSLSIQKDPATRTEPEKQFVETQKSIYKKLADKISGSIPASPRRVNQIPIPTSQLVWVFGAHNVAYIAEQIHDQIRSHTACEDTPYHLDVQAVLRNELSAAYAFLASPKAQRLWSHCIPELAEAIRTQDILSIITIQEIFFNDLKNFSLTKHIMIGDKELPISRSLTSILAWAIIIDSALLNQRFLEEMQATHTAKGCSCAPQGWVPLFLPHPPADVC
jgi:hypothetical protein